MARRATKAVPLTDEQRRLASAPRSLAAARAIARPWARVFPHLADEVESAALLGLVEAASRFRPEAGVLFQTYAGRRIHGAIQDALRGALPQGYRRRAAEAPAVTGLAAADVPAAPGAAGWEVDSQDGVDGLTRTLPEKYRAALRLYYTDASAASCRRVGLRLGLCESRVSGLIHEALDLLRVELALRGRTES